jgi:DHA1 family multidrug resistance protein-like MFS transporter
MFLQLLTKVRQIEPWHRTLYIMFGVQLAAAIGFSTIFPFLPLYVRSLDSSLGLSVEILAGLVFSAQAATMMVASPLWGALADRHGRKLMVQRATFGGAVLVALMGFVTSAEQLIVLRAIQGGVTGVISAVNALVAAAAPRERSGYAMGVVQVGLGSGVALGPLIGGVLADAFGYRMAFVMTGLLLFMAGLLVSVGVEEKLSTVSQQQHRQRSFMADWRDILTASGVPQTYSLTFLSTLCRVMLIPIAPLFILTLLPESASVNTFTGLVIGVSAGAGTVAAIFLGRLGDRVGHQKILILSALVAGLLFLPQMLVTSAWQLLLLQTMSGAAAGGMLPTLGALLAGYTRPGDEGSAYGIENSLRSASQAVAPLVGAAIATWFSLRLTFAATGVLFLVVAGLARWLLPKSHSKGEVI